MKVQKVRRLSRLATPSYEMYDNDTYQLAKFRKNPTRLKTYWERRTSVKTLKTLLEQNVEINFLQESIWSALLAFQGYPFHTSKGLDYCYYIKGNEIFFSRKDKSITKATVNLAIKRALELDRVVTGPKKLGCFGASYLYPVLIRIGFIGR